MRALSLSLALMLPSAALASAPTIGVDAKGHVTGQVVVPVSADQVHQQLRDVKHSDGLSTDVIETTTANAGACVEVTRAVKGLWSPLTYTAKRCPTQSGWSETLVRSDDFATYESEWEVVEVEGGTQINYRVQTTPNMMVPASVVRSRTKSSVKTMLLKLVERLTPSRRNRR